MLSRDEQVVMHLRTHIKSLIGVILILFLASALLGIGLALIPEQYKPWTTWVLLGLYLIAIIWFVLKPWLLWLSATYTVTNRRIITRKGIFNKTGHDFPLRSINNVNYETLILETAAEKPLTLPDVPGVERVHVVIADLIFDGEPDPE